MVWGLLDAVGYPEHPKARYPWAINALVVIMLLGLGYAYQQTGRLVEAEQAYLRALELDPKHPRAYWNLENPCSVGKN